MSDNTRFLSIDQFLEWVRSDLRRYRAHFMKEPQHTARDEVWTFEEFEQDMEKFLRDGE